MTRNKIYILLTSIVLLTTALFALKPAKNSIDDKIISYTVDLTSKEIDFYWKDDSGKIIRSIRNLKNFVESKNRKLLFAMNGGMYNPDNTPTGLFIRQFKTVTPIDTSSGEGNFYLKPNGVFYITKENKPVVCNTEKFKNDGQVKLATQSGPMLVIDGKIHPSFKKGSENLNIRNGVGILPDNQVIFAISKTKVNLYDFASYFKSKGCKNALYFDGFVSRMFLPEKNWEQTDGSFGVIIAITTAGN